MYTKIWATKQVIQAMSSIFAISVFAIDVIATSIFIANILPHN